MNKSIGLFFAAISQICASSADSAQARIDRLEEAFRRVSAKSGIHIGGEFKSQYFYSGLSGNGADSIRRLDETNEYTSVDFDITARPNDAIGGSIIFRMHQNWQNFFSDIANPIFSRWISIDGTGWDVVRYNAGDFRARFSPLTMWTPEISPLFEPFIFKRSRSQAMQEEFLGDNNRLLQGLQAGFDAEIYPLFNEVHFAALGTRLRNVQTNIQNGSKVTNVVEFSKTEKLLAGANLDVRYLTGITTGASYLQIFDRKGSMAGSDTTIDTSAQNTRVGAIRGGIDLGALLEWERLALKLNIEDAFSIDDTVWFDTTNGFGEDNLFGNAMKAGINIGYQVDNSFSAMLDVAFINNDLDFRNELAQSPSFVGSRIMNIENDSIAGTGNNATLVPNHYSTFDALYHYVFKFSPKQATNLYSKAPFAKNSYTRVIFDQQELGALRSHLDPAVQLVMPFGPATPNRSGITAELRGDLLDNALEFAGIVKSLNEIEETGASIAIDSVTDTLVMFAQSSFAQIGGGLSYDVASIVPFLKHSLKLSGSFVRSTSDNEGPQDFGGYAMQITSDFINAGLNFKFWKRAALLGGLQMIMTDMTANSITTGIRQMHWSTGLQWEVFAGADVVFSLGQISVSHESDVDGIDASGDDFQQMLVDVSLQVRF
ncbi:MAG: hypothetical protein GF398_00205 [Chitinivibrionales bacterium]|nr:hypothetical protein [Chitinivibrionales bacterium]